MTRAANVISRLNRLTLDTYHLRHGYCFTTRLPRVGASIVSEIRLALIQCAYIAPYNRREDLEDLLADPVYFQAIFHSLQQVKALYQGQAELGMANESIAGKPSPHHKRCL